MMSPSSIRNRTHYVHQHGESDARRRAIEILNEKKLQHPPDLYYIRRNVDKFNFYLDEKNMSEVHSEVRPENKLNYSLFKLEKREKDEMDLAMKRQRNFKNPADPFLRPKIFNREHSHVATTNRLLRIIEPKEHNQLMKNSKAEIENRSRKLLDKFLDRDQKYYNISPNFAIAKSQKSGQNCTYRHHDIVRMQNQREMKELAKQASYVVNENGKEPEYKKLQRIGDELEGSNSLTDVSKKQDILDFENETNQNFNKQYLPVLQTQYNQYTNDYNTQTPRNDKMLRELEMNHNGLLFDEKRAKGFTFSKRHERNKSSATDLHELNSTIGKMRNSRKQLRGAGLSLSTVGMENNLLFSPRQVGQRKASEI